MRPVLLIPQGGEIGSRLKWLAFQPCVASISKSALITCASPPILESLLMHVNIKTISFVLMFKGGICPTSPPSIYGNHPPICFTIAASGTLTCDSSTDQALSHHVISLWSVEMNMSQQQNESGNVSSIQYQILCVLSPSKSTTVFAIFLTQKRAVTITTVLETDKFSNFSSTSRRHIYVCKPSGTNAFCNQGFSFVRCLRSKDFHNFNDTRVDIIQKESLLCSVCYV